LQPQKLHESIELIADPRYAIRFAGARESSKNPKGVARKWLELVK
jgi:hypothetical protein